MRAALFLLALVSIPCGASAWCRMTTSQRRPTAAMPCVLPDATTSPPEMFLAWRRRCTTIALAATADTNDDELAVSHDMSTADVRAVVQRSIATWQAVSCEGTSIGLQISLLDDESSCTAPLFRDGGANANTIMFVADWENRQYDPAAFAVTTVWHRKSTGAILDADMEINERRGPYGICPAGGCTDVRLVDLENVVTHELGHYFGLAHSTDPDATMFASATAGEVGKRDLSPDDLAGICTIYPPGSLPDTCDNTPEGGLRLDCHGGCSISVSRSGSAPVLLIASFIAIVMTRRHSSRTRRATS